MSAPKLVYVTLIRTTLRLASAWSGRPIKWANGWGSNPLTTYAMTFS